MRGARAYKSSDVEMQSTVIWKLQKMLKTIKRAFMLYLDRKNWTKKCNYWTADLWRSVKVGGELPGYSLRKEYVITNQLYFNCSWVHSSDYLTSISWTPTVRQTRCTKDTKTTKKGDNVLILLKMIIQQGDTY